MKTIQYLLLSVLIFVAFSSCAKEEDPIEPCQTCQQLIENKLVRIEVCPESLTYYEDGVHVQTLPHGGEVADFVESHTYGGFTCK